MTTPFSAYGRACVVSCGSGPTLSLYRPDGLFISTLRHRVNFAADERARPSAQARWYATLQTMSTSPLPSSRPSVLKSLFTVIGAGLDFALTLLRRMPILALVAVIVIVALYQRSSQESEDTQAPKFRDPTEMPAEPPPPADLPAGTNPSVWTCVHRVDTELSKGLWADIYYGMEVRLDGKVVTVKVTEKWQGLSDDKRRTVANLIVDTWVENGQALQVLNSKDELEEVVLKRVSDDQTVAAWKPTTGVQLFEPQVGA